ncbi:Flotillin-like protein 4 [Acorus calamus]|uniref:Flotillin-like n=1 Tax=Acorus calamus TaxID=4465 RepID=A0AAV9D4P6_ACOCL|nr:Flotillin-like protein 4 [Acorus calamus]
MAVYRVAKPSEYLAVTGWGIEDIQITKKAWIFIGQSYTVLDLTPVTHTLEVQATSAEKLPFILPVVFTIGPRNHKKSLIKYAELMSPHDKPSNHITELVKGVIEGETRVLAASMIMEQIFKGINEFKQQVLDKVQQELKKFGLLIYNAYVKQLIDVPGHMYCSYLGQKTQMEEVNQEMIDLMDAKKKGEIGLTEELNVCSDAKISEDKRETEIVDANADLATEKAKMAEFEVAKTVTIQEAEHQNTMMHTAKSKAELLSKATVAYELK